jgi:polysaccharide biosynthesis protein PslG
VWIMEFGWTSDPNNPSYAWHRVSEEEKARYVVEAYRWANRNWKDWIGVMLVWNLASPGWTPDHEQYWWSISNPDGSNRPAYEALLAARRTGYLP